MSSESTKKRNGLELPSKETEGPPKRRRLGKDTIRNIVSPDRVASKNDKQDEALVEGTPTQTKEDEAKGFGEEGDTGSTNLKSCTPTPSKDSSQARGRDEKSEDDTTSTASDTDEAKCPPSAALAKCPSSAASQGEPDAPKSHSEEGDNEALAGPRRSNRKKAPPVGEENYVDSTSRDFMSYTSTTIHFSWETRFQHLEAFKAKHGHPNPTQKAGTPPDDFKLAVWLAGQRRNFRNKKLPEDKRAQLIEIGCTGFGQEKTKTNKKKPAEVKSVGPQGDDKLDQDETDKIEVIKVVKSKKVKPGTKMSWETRFEHLQEFKAKHGHPNPTQGAGTPPSDYKLAVWLSGQRRNFRNHKLPEDKREQLVELGCTGFEHDKDDCKPNEVTSLGPLGNQWDGKDDHDDDHKADGDKRATEEEDASDDDEQETWDNRYSELKIFYRQHGHGNVTISARDVRRGDTKLAVWLNQQRQLFVKGLLSSYRAELLYDLNCLGFDLSDIAQNLPSPPKPHKRTKLTPKKRHSKSIPPMQIYLPWNIHFKALKRYRQEHGHANPRSNSNSSNAQWLSAWLRLLQGAFQKGMLPNDKAQSLRDLGCVGFGGHDESDDESESSEEEDANANRYSETRSMVPWETRFQELEKYEQLHGHANPPIWKSSSKAHFRLASWLGEQQGAFRKGIISEAKAKNLRDLGCFGFGNDNGETNDDWCKDIQPIQKRIYFSWKDRMQQLEEYKERNDGNANPPNSKAVSKADGKLGQWLVDQRKKFRQGILSEDRARQLHEVGCDGFGGDNATGMVRRRKHPGWYSSFQELQEFKEKNQHANPRRVKTSPEYKLGRWLSDQRQKFRKGHLSLEKAKELRELGCSGFSDVDVNASLSERSDGESSDSSEE